MKANNLSRATMGRLPTYLLFVRGLPKDTRTISATKIAKGLGLGEVQVRKDFSAVCGAGKPKIGYDRKALEASIAAALGSRSDCEAVIVGAGKLGMALRGFDGFSEYGITVTRIFDKNPTDSTVLPMEDLFPYCTLHQTEIGIIAVPKEAAQEVADRLIQSGVRALFCFSPARLTVPENVTVQYENIALSLAHLCQRIKK